MDYKNKLNEINGLLTHKKYKTIIRDVGFVFEVALKDVYKKQIEFFEVNINNEILANEYENLKNKQRELFPEFDFDIDSASFFDTINLFERTNFNQLIELRTNQPLTFTYDIPLHRIRMTRNRVTHNANVNISRTEAYRFISYLKTYLRETGLVNDDVITGEIRCYSCNRLIDRQWHYCPDCGADLSSTCKTCGEHLKPGWTNCPVCSTPRDGVKVSNPKTVYGFYCQAVWSDGYLNAEEMRFLRRKQRELGLDDAKALKIQKKYAPDAAMIFRGMVEASLTDGVIDNREKIFLRNEADRLGIDHKLANSIYLSCINDTISEPLFNEEDDGS